MFTTTTALTAVQEWMVNDMRIEEAIKFAEHAQTMTDIPEVKEFYAMAEKALRTQNQVNWISVKDRLPEEWKSVLVCLPTQGGIGMYVSERFNGDRWIALFGRKPTHWMPLPDGPKEEGAEEYDSKE